VDSKDLLIDIFEHYYRQIYNDSGFRVNKKSNDKLISNFFSLLEKEGYHLSSISSNLLEDYIRYQAQYWYSKDTNRKPTLSWFIGKKALFRYLSEEDPEQYGYWVSKNIGHLTPYNYKTFGISEYEIDLREKYRTSSNTLLLCLENTSLYIKHRVCLSCNHREECKALLKQNYPLLSRRREIQ